MKRGIGIWMLVGLLTACGTARMTTGSDRPPLPDPEDVCSCMDDPTFRAYCYTHFDVNQDGKISTTEANSVTRIHIFNAPIRNLTGIGYFPHLREVNFRGCKDLTYADLRHNTRLRKLSNGAFWGCSRLTEILLPESLTELGNQTFSECQQLRRIVLPEGLKTIGPGAFMRCRSLSQIVLPESVTTIDYGAFSRCDRLTQITIPDKVTEIGNGAFAQTPRLRAFFGKFASDDRRCLIVNGELKAFAPDGLQEYTLPDEVESLAPDIFTACTRLRAFFGKFTSDDRRCLIVNGELKAFAPAGLSEYTLPEGITAVGASVFYGCDRLVRIRIGAGVQTIGRGAFEQCSHLKNVTLSDDLTAIGNLAFRRCTKLTHITIPASVTTIGGRAFADASRLARVDCHPTTPPALGRSYDGTAVFHNNAPGRKFYVPSASWEAYRTAEAWSEYSADMVGCNF